MENIQQDGGWVEITETFPRQKVGVNVSMDGTVTLAPSKAEMYPYFAFIDEAEIIFCLSVGSSSRIIGRMPATDFSQKILMEKRASSH